MLRCLPKLSLSLNRTLWLSGANFPRLCFHKPFLFMFSFLSSSASPSPLHFSSYSSNLEFLQSACLSLLQMTFASTLNLSPKVNVISWLLMISTQCCQSVLLTCNSGHVTLCTKFFNCPSYALRIKSHFLIKAFIYSFNQTNVFLLTCVLRMVLVQTDTILNKIPYTLMKFTF